MGGELRFWRRGAADAFPHAKVGTKEVREALAALEAAPPPVPAAAQPAAAARPEGESHGLQLQSLWILPTVAVSSHVFGRPAAPSRAELGALKLVRHGIHPYGEPLP